ncbi:MAG: selenocysteine-specific translation elongation factor [Anaerolineae bacterium]|nr:selenocysteine-specific translation elongation factor [Anaerolineae bacterium]
MYVIGTAGHVDHGKSTLVEALTGIDPDRLREEKEREMTIDLGFAWITLPGEVQVGVVDVPGHRDFIENMLAGVGGIDASLFVVAADEGVMPQTREHLAILDLLGVPAGVIALTKIDMVDDPEWLDLVEMELRDVLQGTVLAEAPLVRVSARTGVGMEVLAQTLAEVLIARPPRVDQGHPRLPVDRIFTISGFGTVVTGTLSGGALALGDAVEMMPGGLNGRIRGLQAYKTKLDAAQPGSRVAVNVTGIEKDTLRRGQVLTHPGWLRETVLIDVRFRHLPDASRPLKHNAQVKFFSGAAEALARVRLLDADQLQPGAEGWLQVRLESPVAVVRGDRFILRYPSPGETIGGGTVVDPAPGRRWRRHRADVITRLETLAQGTPGELVAQALNRAGQPLKLKALQQQVNMPADEVSAALDEATDEGLVLPLGKDWVWDAGTRGAAHQRLERELGAFHAAEPLRYGMPREQLRSRLGLDRGVFDLVLADATSLIETSGELVWRRGHAVQLTARQQALVDDLLAQFARSPYQPPAVREAVAAVGEDLFRYLVDRRDLVVVAPDVVLAAAVFATLYRFVRETLDRQGEITAAELRDEFATTRKYAIAFLEYLDAQGITRRDGDVRRWLRRPEHEPDL